MLSPNPQGDYPRIDKSVYIDSAARIIGKVSIGRNVFVGPGAVIRADEPGSLIAISNNCNVQDRVIIHALKDSSVLIKESTSLSHGCIIHGPCEIDRNCFIGFGSVIFKSKIGEGTFIKHLAVIERADVLPGRVVESGQVVVSQDDVNELRCTNERDKTFMEEIVKVNQNLTTGYKHGQENSVRNNY
ncbi:MAG: carbonate dehydratase [Candidatus Omnitrophota bacterium]